MYQLTGMPRVPRRADAPTRVGQGLFSLGESLAALQVWLTGCQVLEENVSVLQECLRLVQQFGVLGKQVHDCNIVATMLVHGVRHLATRNVADFRRYGNLLSLEAVTV